MNFRIHKTDALIIGGGLSGYMAAYWTSKKYNTVLLSTGRGASPFISGYNVPVTKEDSVDCYIADSIENSHGVARTDLIKQLCEKSVETIPFLESLGFQFDKDDNGELCVRWPVGSSHPRVIGQGNTTGGIIVDYLYKEISPRDNVTLEKSVRALRLMVRNGEICGALCLNTKTLELICYEASVVVLATGGFSRIYEFSTNTADIGGDGIAMAYELGVPLVNMEFIQFEPAGSVWPVEIQGDGMITTLNNEGAVMKNRLGERFMFKYDARGEKVNKDILGRSIYQEVMAGYGTDHGGIWYDCTAVSAERIHSAYEMYYKRYANCGIDITKEAVEVFPSAHTSLGGVEINADCSTNLRGLFACGEVTGAVHGASRIGGAAGLEMQVFGRIAGESAANYLGSNDSIKVNKNDWDAFVSDSLIFKGKNAPLTAERMKALRIRMGTILTQKLNVVRNEEDMQNAKSELREMLSEIKNSGDQTEIEKKFMKIRLEHDLLTAVLFTSAAIERKENCGCHWRTDAQEAPEKQYWIKLQRNDDGDDTIKCVSAN